MFLPGAKARKEGKGKGAKGTAKKRRADDIVGEDEVLKVVRRSESVDAKAEVAATNDGGDDEKGEAGTEA